jgi:hypothetical protein
MAINLSIAGKLHRIETGIYGVFNSEEIQVKMAAFGYTAERITEGENLLKKAKQMIASQVEEYSDQYLATTVLGKQWSKAYSAYMVTLKVARVAFTNQSEVLSRFKATGARKRTLSGWLNDARIFYDNLLNDPKALDRMKQFGYTTDRLQSEQQAVNEVKTLHGQQLSEKGEAQQSTVERDKVLDELYDWYGNFRAIARIALYDKPQLLESLGIIKK